MCQHMLDLDSFKFKIKQIKIWFYIVVPIPYVKGCGRF